MSDIVLSCQVQEVAIFTDHEWVDVAMKMIGGDTLLSSRFWAYSGVVKLHDLRSLMELGIANTGESVQSFTVEAVHDDERESMTVKVVYCCSHLEVHELQQFFQQNFLSLAPSRRIADDAVVFVSFFAYAGEPLECTVVADVTDEEGDAVQIDFIAAFEGMRADADKVYSTTIDASAVAARCAEEICMGTTLNSFVVRCGARAIACFVDPALNDAPNFYFRNTFNAPDMVFFPGVTTKKTGAERSVAVLMDTAMHYDASNKAEYAVQSDGLTEQECALVEQMMTSREVRYSPPAKVRGEGLEVRVMEFEDLIPVLITDSTCEIVDLPERPNAVKFTWRFAKNGLLLNAPKSVNIFSDSYNNVFT